MREGGVDAVHATLVYHETCRETLQRLGEWNRRFEDFSDLIMPVREAGDIERARHAGKTGIFLGPRIAHPLKTTLIWWQSCANWVC